MYSYSALPGMVLIQVLILCHCVILTGVLSAPLHTKPHNSSVDITTTEPAYEQYGGLIPGSDEYNKAFSKRPRQSSRDQVTERMPLRADRNGKDMVADSPGDEEATATIVRHGKDEESDGERSRKNKERKRKKYRNKNRDRSDGDVTDDGCSERSDVELKEMLGPAFNGRYMSIDRPAEGDDTPVVTEPTNTDNEAMSDDAGETAVRTMPFHVDSNYRRELPPDFYLDIAWYQEVIQSLPESAARLLRRIRSVFSSPTGQPEATSLPWQCESEIIWTDLGANYYPRFLRNVRCTRDNCWFGHFKCRPKAFTVNVLKRVRDSCKDGANGQEWVYEERAVTFCCECVEY